jgi:hypothetical protein
LFRWRRSAASRLAARCSCPRPRRCGRRSAAARRAPPRRVRRRRPAPGPACPCTSSEPGPPRKALRHEPGLATLAPGPAPPLHRPLAHPQSGGDLAVRLPAREADDGLQPDPLPRCPLSLGQPTTLRVSHSPGATGASRPLSGERPDITQSSSVTCPALPCPALCAERARISRVRWRRLVAARSTQVPPVQGFSGELGFQLKSGADCNRHGS